MTFQGDEKACAKTHGLRSHARSLMELEVISFERWVKFEGRGRQTCRQVQSTRAKCSITEFKYYPKGHRKALKNFKPGNDTIISVCLVGMHLLVCMLSTSIFWVPDILGTVNYLISSPKRLKIQFTRLLIVLLLTGKRSVITRKEYHKMSFSKQTLIQCPLKFT